MSKEFLDVRREALEASFFATGAESRLSELRAWRGAAEARDRLATVAGLHDAEVLDRLVALDVRPETWIALTLVPLIEVAWADGRIDPEEREAILAAAHTDGVERGSPAHGMLEAWLDARPGAGLLASWEAMTSLLCGRFAGPERTALKAEVMGRARRVAEAAGDFIGFGDKVSAEERGVMERLEKAFE